MLISPEVDVDRVKADEAWAKGGAKCPALPWPICSAGFARPFGFSTVIPGGRRLPVRV
jgi:hypothetical protein